MLESPVDVDTSSNESPSTDFPPKKKVEDYFMNILN